MSLLDNEKKAAERERSVHNERVKLTSSYVNTMAGSVLTVGGLAPIFAVLYGATSPAVPTFVVLGIAFVCWGASVTLHWRARVYLREMK